MEWNIHKHIFIISYLNSAQKVHLGGTLTLGVGVGGKVVYMVEEIEKKFMGLGVYLKDLIREKVTLF